MFGVCANENTSFKDTLSVYKVNSAGEFTEKIFETVNHPTLIQRIKRKLGLCNYADDILMNEGLADIAAWLATRYDYMGVGTSATGPSTVTYHDLVAPAFTRVSVSTSIETTYTADDTVVFTGVFTAASSTSLYEAGIFKDATTSVTDVMLCRQTFAAYPVIATESFGIIWKVICSRG